VSHWGWESLLLRTFRYRLSLTPRQTRLLNQALAICCELYNAALQERRDAWRTARKSIGLYDQTKELTEIRTIREDVASLPVDLAREPLRRVDRAFRAFFRRAKAGQKPGYPRFRSRERYNSLALSAPHFRMEGNQLWISKLGGFRLRLHRPLRGTPRHCTMLRCGGRWRVSIVSDIGRAPEKVAVRKAVGIDVGLENFATLDDGTVVENPRWLARSAAELAAQQRSLAGKKRGGSNYRKARQQVARCYERIAHRRANFCHHLSKWLVASYDLIVFEKLNIPEMVAANLARSILDAAWGMLGKQLTYKAEEAGKWGIPVAPGFTTQICSGCGRVRRKPLSERVHRCSCGLLMSRDQNAAINILRLGRSRGEISQESWSTRN
jgi:putative transposase